MVTRQQRREGQNTTAAVAATTVETKGNKIEVIQPIEVDAEQATKETRHGDTTAKERTYF